MQKNETKPTPTNSEDKTTTSQLKIKNTESGYNFSLVLPKRDKMSSEYSQKLEEITCV